MNDERIHQHDWENGRCRVCGLSQQKTAGELPESSMSKRELTERLDKIEQRISAAEKFINLELLILAIMLLVLLFRGC
jgi:hypothetical protein